MPELNPNIAFGTLGLALRVQIADGLPGHTRPLEYFGGSAVDYDETPTDNLAAFNLALDWCAETGGLVVLGAGIYGVDGAVQLRSYANITSVGKFHSRVQQLAASPTDVFTSSDAANESIAFVQLSNFTIDGGWSPRWNEDRATHTAAAIRLLGDFDGPDDPGALARENTSSMADPYHVVRDMRITGVAGSGIVTTGRGEMQILNNAIGKCSLYGMDLGAPDCWFANNTVRVTGDSAVRVTSGNQRFSNEKYWFTGMRTDQEGVGAGLEMVGAAISNFTASNLTTQDTWGPGLVLDGDSPIIDGNIDEAGGGRVEQQYFGWRENRTLARSNIRFGGPCRNASVRMSLAGGNRLGETHRPKLVHFQSSGVKDNRLDLSSEGLSLDTAAIATDAGYTNSRRFNLVTLNGEILHGKLTPAQLADATHGINTESRADLVHLTDGSIALRTASGWSVLSGTPVIPG